MNILNVLEKRIKNIKLFVAKRIVHTVDKKQVLLVLPFLGPLSFEIRFCYKNVLKIASVIVH